MTGELYRNQNLKSVYRESGRLSICVEKGVRHATKVVPKKVDDFSAWVGSAAIGLIVFFICWLSCSGSRGFNGGIGGEVIFAAIVTVIVKVCFSKIKSTFGQS